MISSSHKQFAGVLGTAIHTVKVQEGKNIGVIQDELGFALGRNGSSFIDYLRRGNVPSQNGDLESLAYELVHRGGLDKDRCWKFLNYGGHPEPKTLISEWFPPDNGTSPYDELKRGPFVIGPPVKHPKCFIGREQELQRIFNCWRYAPLQNIAVIGPRRSGKTSFLYHLMQISSAKPEQLRADQWQVSPPTAENFRWIFIDFQDSRMWKIGRLLTHILLGLDLRIPEPCNLENFLDTVESSRFRRPTIILMDEIDVGLAAPELDEGFWWSLRSLISLHMSGNIGYVVASHKSLAEPRSKQDSAHPFFNLFVTLELGPFLETEARKFIENLPHNFSDNDIEWMLHHSKLWPALLQLLCQLKLYALEGREADGEWREEGLRLLSLFPDLLSTNESPALARSFDP